jgi:hemolysin III
MEEKLNAITHGVGAILAVVGLISLIVVANMNGGIWHLVSFSIYGTSLVLLYLTSTLYHSVTNERLKHIFKIADHSAIYLLIAGTYTPFTLVSLHGLIGWIVFGITWGLAAIGILFKVFFVKRFKLFSTLCYIVMGWMIVAFVKPLIATLPMMWLYWLIAGGVFYTVGAGFYLARRMPYNHAVWHLFVLAGSASHFVAVFKYVSATSV